MKSAAVYRFIIKPTYMNIFLKLQQGPAKIKEISNEIGIAYSHLTIVFQEMQKEELVDRTKDKNTFEVTLTEKGKKLADAFVEVKKVVENYKEPKVAPPKTIDPADEDLHCYNKDTNCSIDECNCECDGCKQQNEVIEDE